MIKRYYCVTAITFCMCLYSHSQNYMPGKITHKKYEITSIYDSLEATKDAEEFLAPYKAKVDSFIGPVIGRSEQYMEVFRPECLLSNWCSDVLLYKAKEISKRDIDFAVINIGGLRSPMPEGDIKSGNISDIAPFVNTLVILTLKGRDVLELFQQFGIYSGEGVSHGIQIIYNPDKTLKSASINGEKFKEDRIYTIATIDYLAEGNDNMKAFTKALTMDNTQIVVRNLYVDYIKEQTKLGKAISSVIEGRSVILEEKSEGER